MPANICQALLTVLSLPRSNLNDTREQGMSELGVFSTMIQAVHYLISNHDLGIFHTRVNISGYDSLVLHPLVFH